MSNPIAISRPLSCWKVAFRHARQQRSQLRTLSTALSTLRMPSPSIPLRARPGDQWIPQKQIPIYPAPPSARKTCPEPLKAFTSTELSRLDPSTSRTRLFSKQNIDQASVGDVLLVRFRNGDPFAGVCINIRRCGVDTAILLRNQVQLIGTEMWVKIYSPMVTGIEIVQRAGRKPRRARLTCMRKPKHDRGDLSGIVGQYMKTRRTIGASESKKRADEEKMKLAEEMKRKKQAGLL